jgi:hypothetical protein
MRKFTQALALVAAAVGLIAVPAAVADAPGIVHDRFSGTFTDPDFCGTGETVNVAISQHATLFGDPNRPGVDEWFTFEGRLVFTNPLNGETVALHFAGQRQIVFPGDPGHEIDTDIGVRSQFVHRGPGGLLLRDAGYVVLDFHFTIVGGEIVLVRGPHPSLVETIEGNDPFCALLTSALRL